MGLRGEDDTICAIATAQGKSAIGIIRVSGREALSIVQPLFHGKGTLRNFATHSVHYAEIRDPVDGTVIDEGLFLVMRGPRSYTGEDIVEVQAHGNPVGLQKILTCLLREGARLAGPGEFTRRAFLSGRMDLSQAEAVMELISSEGAVHHHWALSQLKGVLSKKIDLLRERLISILAEIEASIDFSDEGISFDRADVIGRKINAVQGEVRRLLSEYEEGRQVREGFTVAIIGRPNVGKSSLMNALLKEERAIVTPYPGTTRDVLREWVELDGFTIRLLDTAGSRKTDHPIEREGVRRGEAAEREADLCLWVIDSSEPLRKEDKALAARLKGKRKIILLNKIDRPAQILRESIQKLHPSDPVVAVSALTGEGLSCLRETMRTFLDTFSERERPVVALVRHRNALERVKEGLERAIASFRDGFPGEFVAIDLRDASDALGEIVGATATEEILDQVFSQFCIGK